MIDVTQFWEQTYCHEISPPKSHMKKKIIIDNLSTKQYFLSIIGVTYKRTYYIMEHNFAILKFKGRIFVSILYMFQNEMDLCTKITLPQLIATAADDFATPYHNSACFQ